MELVLAIDLKGGLVVHGASGKREEYRPLDWGLSPSAEPFAFVGSIRPRHLYIADLDRIAGTGDHDEVTGRLAGLLDKCLVDRGCRFPEDRHPCPVVMNVIGTETAGPDLAGYQGGFLSVDVRSGRTVPAGEAPEEVLRRAEGLAFDGCILLDISAVGTSRGLNPERLEDIRAAYSGYLLYGGGVSSPRDLDLLDDEGFDGAIIATALHRGAVPAEAIRRGFHARYH
jgi:phosphoribosylformimino-5-aminoimidazole carboxamide ribotide isomerase